MTAGIEPSRARGFGAAQAIRAPAGAGERARGRSGLA